MNLLQPKSPSQKVRTCSSVIDGVNRMKQDKRLEVEYMTLYEIFKEEFESGKRDGKIEIAHNLLDVLDDETIALKTGLTIEEVRRLREEG